MNGRPQLRFALVMVLATLALRAVVPAGFMPAAIGNGLPFEMCPSAVPAEILAAMSGAGHSHHQHHAGHNAAGSDGHFNTGDCPIGQALSAAVAFDDLQPAVIAPAAAPLNASEPAALPSLEQPVRRSRDPPA
jgi:hypothetical protein